MCEVMGILFDCHIHSKGGGRHPKCNSCHAVVLEEIIRASSPDKSVEISVRLGKHDCGVHFADISYEGYMMTTEM